MTAGDLVLLVLLAAALMTTAALAVTVRRLGADLDRTRAALEQVERTLADLATQRQEAAARPTSEYVITSAPHPEPEPEPVPTARVVSATLGEPLVKVAALSYGVRRALREERRAHLAYQVRREYRRRRRLSRSGARQGR